MMRLNPLLALSSLLALSLALSGCGPIYSTQYRYTPPLDTNGKMCINQCASSRDLCRQLEESRASQEQAQCQQNATMRYALCLSNAKTDQARSQCNSSSYCSRSANTERCEESYRQCFQNCGGKIDSFQVCDFGC
jgi:hypothetical protein